MKHFFEQLRRRPIYKFGVIYLAAAWLLMQVTVSIEEPLSLPGWLDTAVIILLAIGFPIVLIVVWLFEGRLGDIEATGESAPAGSSAPAAPEFKPIRPDVRFCTTPSGYRLAYSRVGRGTPLVRTGNWLSHQELEWDNPLFRAMLRDLSTEFDLITYDGRGTGLSDPDVAEFSLETMVEDMEVVVDACNLDRFAVLAYSQSCAVSIAFAARHPERVSHMVLFGGFAHNFRTAEEIDAIATLFGQSWGQSNPATRQLFTTQLIPDATKEEFDAMNELQRNSVSPANVARLFRAIHRIDVRDDAKLVTVPTLVMHSREEPGVPLEFGREMATLIPRARFITLDSRNHILLEREPAYKQFLDEAVAFIKSKQ